MRKLIIIVLVILILISLFLAFVAIPSQTARIYGPPASWLTLFQRVQYSAQLLWYDGLLTRSLNAQAPPLEEATVASLQAAMQSGQLSAESLTQAYLARIDELDPKINSVIERNPDALALAKQLDDERKAGKTRGAMHGIPVLIKDNIDTADKMMTAAGSLALAGASAPRDAFIVEQLRKAGAVILGKTNLSEWANCNCSRF